MVFHLVFGLSTPRALRGLCVMCWGVSLGAALAPGSAAAASGEIDFSRDVQPILSENCFHCHGPDEGSRKAKLRLDTHEGAFMARKDVTTIAPGKSDGSEIFLRISSPHEDEVMPPPESKKKLTSEQIDLVKRWIDQGANWGRHWAYESPRRAASPIVSRPEWTKSPLDRFILAQLEAHGLAPTPEAPRPQLLRRLALDLIGLPPTPAEIAEFELDARPDAYERAVDRLLASPHYGERWARPWLDLARYADSNGFQRDGFRDLWPFRDWVIRALNADMPFDRFTIEQIAGDLLPGSSESQKIATGFHRTVTVNVEAGTDPEENRVNQIFDRVNTTGTVWLGVSYECAQCHNHKYDPLTQKDYYRLFAFFNNTEHETQSKKPNDSSAVEFSGPYLPIDAPEIDARRAPVAARAAASRSELEKVIRARTAAGGPVVAASTENEDDPEQVSPAKSENPEDRQLETMKKGVVQLERELDALPSARTLVMRERPEARSTFLFKRGNFLDPGEPITPGVPSFLHPLPEGQPTRLTLARWLVSRDNPLVARVAVNRWWAEFFGHGLVATAEDFGVQGDKPTHPELLDWLAVEFMERGWSMKSLHKLIVMSAAYRQDSRFTPELKEIDERNLLYARGPRFRLDAEAIRDHALAVAGLLSPRLFGPSVRPYQPEGIWRVIGNVDNTYRLSEGDDRYRRGLYVVWRRSALYPSFGNFDATPRTTCTVKRSRSNTPLQALTLLNDPVYVEAAQGLAARLLAELPNAGSAERIERAFQLCLSRAPRPAELQRLLQLHRTFAAMDDATAPPARVGPWPVAVTVGAAEFAAWQAVATALLNLDESISKG